MLSGLKTAATVTCDSVIRTKDSGYRNAMIVSSGLKIADTVASKMVQF